jgi:hypothetical protein
MTGRRRLDCVLQRRELIVSLEQLLQEVKSKPIAVAWRMSW